MTIVSKNSVTEAREREERARKLLLDAQRQMMPPSMISFLGRKLSEVQVEVRDAEMREMSLEMERITRPLPMVEATPADARDMDRYMAARRQGFGSRTAPVPSGADRETAEAKYIESRAAQQRKMFETFAIPPRKLMRGVPPTVPPSTAVVTDAELTKLMKEIYTKQASENDYVFRDEMFGDWLGAGKRDDLVPRQRDEARYGVRVAPATPPKPKAQTVAAPVVGKRKISFDDR
jgi:hypothetical protein